MNEERRRRDERFARRVGQRERRKLRARRQAGRDVWFGLGMYGLVGWSVAAPTVLGVAFGIWLDDRYPGRVSWTLTLLGVGLAVGCWTAWFWVAREQRLIGAGDEEPDEPVPPGPTSTGPAAGPAADPTSTEPPPDPTSTEPATGPAAGPTGRPVGGEGDGHG